MTIINRKVFVDALKTVGPALRATSLPILSGVLLDGDTLTASNLDLTIRTTLQVTDPHPQPAVIPAKRLAAVVSRCKGDTVTLEFDGDTVTVASGSTTASIATMPADEWPKLDEPSSDWHDLTAADLDVIRRVIPAASTDQGRPILCGVHFDGTTVTATDSYKLARATISTELPEMLIPAAALASVLANADEVSVTFDGQAALFVAGNTRWTTRLIGGEFPNAGGLIPTKTLPVQVSVNVTDLDKAIKVTAAIGVQNDNPVRITSDAGQLTVTRRFDGDTVSDTIDCAGGLDFEVAFNGRWLGDLLGCVTSADVTLELTDHLKPVVMHDGDWLGLLMPVRVS